MKIVCFGDSITGPTPRQRYLGQYIKYADLLDLMLEARLGAPVEVVNAGRAGQTAVEALERFERDVLDERPDIVTVLLGGNDAGRLGDLDGDALRASAQAATEAALKAIYDRLASAGIRSLVLQYHCLPNPENPETVWSHLVANNAVSRKLAERAGLPVLDVGAAMDEATAKYAVTELVNAVDGVHLNPAGEIVYARSIYAELLRLGWV